jgi:hypothetical protein
MEAGLVAERRLELPLLKFRTWCLVYAKKKKKITVENRNWFIKGSGDCMYNSNLLRLLNPFS